MALGHRPGDGEDERFNMAVMGLRLAGRSNGVAKLHGAVSREMFGDLWPDVPVEEAPITSVTNGVHAHTWVSPEMAELLSRQVLPDWHEAEAGPWELLAEVRDDELWRVRDQCREQLVAYVRRHLREQLMARGQSASDVEWTDSVLDPKALTICFARRFATYKRATLLLSKPERLRRLLLSGDRPVQLVFAGKAHPADDSGKELIRQLSTFAADPELRHRIVFLEDYDIAMARSLLQGADVWLNNPRRPQEACGTRGMKAALNGGLNLSILDGWWDECFDGDNGWAISSAEHEEDLDKRDEIEAGSLFELLERQVVPLFYDRWQGPVPRRWVQRVQRSLISLGPFVTAARMVRDYAEQLYEPTAAKADDLVAGDHTRARELSRVEDPDPRRVARRARRPPRSPGGRGRARHRAHGRGHRRPRGPEPERRRGAAHPRTRRAGGRAHRDHRRADGPRRRCRRRPPPLHRSLPVRAGRPLRRHGPHRPRPPGSGDAARARRHRMGLTPPG